jgi:DNA topoisomerase-1
MERQIGTAMWVIDILALRVGGEKSDDEADTVGCCSLRVEHLTFGEDGVNEIELEFLGKDSMLFKQNVNFAKYGDLGIKVFDNLKSFCRKKSSTDDVFQDLNPTILNEHLSSLMTGLSAKVFRTYNASETLQTELPTAESLKGLSVQDKVLRYNTANRQVAILCNHQKTVSKSMETSLETFAEKLDIIKDQNRELLEWKTMAKKGKASKIPLKDDDQATLNKFNDMLKKALQRKQDAKTADEKLAATKAESDARDAIKMVRN